jgi:hypothetical protein
LLNTTAFLNIRWTEAATTTGINFFLGTPAALKTWNNNQIERVVPMHGTMGRVVYGYASVTPDIVNTDGFPAHSKPRSNSKRRLLTSSSPGRRSYSKAKDISCLRMINLIRLPGLNSSQNLSKREPRRDPEIMDRAGRVRMLDIVTDQAQVPVTICPEKYLDPIFSCTLFSAEEVHIFFRIQWT